MSCCGKNNADKTINESSRGCTNVLCLAIFVIFWGLLIFIAAFAFVIGNPYFLIYGQDSFGNTCGIKNEELGNMTFSGMDMTDRPYLFLLNLTNVYQSLKICVKKCPDKMLMGESDIIDFELSSGSRLCRYDIANFAEKSDLYPLVRNETIEKYFLRVGEKNGYYACPVPPVYATKPLFNRCVPLPVANLASDIMNSVYEYLRSFDLIQEVVSDIYIERYKILGMIGLAFFLSFVTAFTIHFLASFVSWIIMVVASIASIAGTGILWWTYADIKWELNAALFNQVLSESEKNERSFLIYSILATIFTVVLLLIVFVLRKRVHVVVNLFEESGKCIKSMPLLLLQPFWTFLGLVIFFVYWVAVLIALATAYFPVKNVVQNPLQIASPSPLPVTLATPSEHEVILNKAFTLVTFNENSWVRYMWWYHILALIWTSEFILGCQQMVIAGAVASWYFMRNKRDASCMIGKSVRRLIFYHLGSVALGSFLITIFKLPRLILTYVIGKMQKHQDIKCVSYCLKCCTCCLWCMEKCINYLNHNAYTVIAIQGVGFCTAAEEAFGILMTNALQVATINSVGDFILFLGKCGITAITTFFTVLLMKNNPELHYFAIPVILVCVFSFFIAHSILSVYEMIIDTLFLCCCEDIRKNDGSKDKPYYGGSLVRYLKGNETGQPLQPLNKGTGDENDGE